MHFFSSYSGIIHVPYNILSGIIHPIRPLFKPQMLRTDYYIAVLINCWAKAIKKSLLFCRVVCASYDGTSCKFFYFYKLVLWIGRTCVCQDTIKQLFEFYAISQIQAKNKILKKKKSCLRIKLLTGEGKREDQGKKAICTTKEWSKFFYSFLLLNMQGGFRKYCDYF